MKVFPLYRDFFTFLERISPHSDQWGLYSRLYYRLHKEFLAAYFSCFPLMDSESLEQRVRAIKPSDYSLLRSLISACPPEKMIREAFEKCLKIVPPKKDPEVYLFVGFFSPDAFVMDFKGKPVICFGMERFRDFRMLRILFAHEYAHFLMNLSRGKVPRGKELKWLLISEGIGTCFSRLVFPDNSLSDHFFFRRDRLNWCQENESYLREIFCSGKFSPEELVDFYNRGNPDLDLPPRAGKYLGFQAVKKHLLKNRKQNLARLLSDKSEALSLTL